MAGIRRLVGTSLCVLLILVTTIITPRVVWALSPEDQDALNNNAVWHTYDNTSCGASPSVDGGGAGSIALTGNDNAEKTWNFFKAKGLTDEQVAGMLGNFLQESGINPTRVQGTGNKNSQDPNSTKSGWGLMQWTPGGKIIGIAKQAGVTTPIYELGTQLEIVWWHLNNVSPTGRKNVLPGFKATTSIEQATEYFEDKMEGAGKPNMPARIKFARQFYTKFSGKAAPAADTASSSTVDNVACPTGTGTAENLNGFTVYSQYDPAWKNKPFGSSTVGESGCGPSAMAMIITTLTGKSVTPDAVAAYAGSQNLYVPGVGSDWNVAPITAKYWELKADKISKNITDISSALSSGKFVIISGAGQKPFTSLGHYIAIRGIDSSGKLLIGDSGHADTSTQAWDAQELLGNAKEGSVYAIYK